MDADEIVIHHVQRDRVRMAPDFLSEGVGQSSEAPRMHSQCEILTLRKRRVRR
jgi:hypothetical protein